MAFKPWNTRRSTIGQKYRVNKEIRAREVRLIGLQGEQVGILPVNEALKLAEEQGYDLVEVAPQANPPVCRIMDYGKFKYEQSKKSHAQRLHQKGSQLKEVKFRPFTSDHDLEIKLRHVRRFLDEGNKVKITVMFRGREMVYQQRMGNALLEKVLKQIAPLGSADQQPSIEGRNVVLILTPRSTKS